MADEYRVPAGHHLMKVFPAEGDSAVAELYLDDHAWAQVELRGIRLDQVGASRVSDVHIYVSLLPPPGDAEPRHWEFDLAEVLEQFEAARSWLIDNEQGRVPLDEVVGPPSRIVVLTWLRLLAAGEISETEASNLASPWIADPREREVADRALWEPLSVLAGADLKVASGEYLYGSRDFEAWLHEFEPTLGQGGPERND